MRPPHPAPKSRERPYVSPVVASPRAACEACRAPMAARTGKRACSGKCRAVLSRRRREDVHDARDQEIRALLAAALTKLGKGAS
jgi:predicted nucleic acid-binding Zn ribbon protein